jgi:hypothetical protein
MGDQGYSTRSHSETPHYAGKLKNMWQQIEHYLWTIHYSDELI